LLDFRDYFERQITLSQARWNHIVEQHPETKKYLLQIKNVLKKPDYIKSSSSDSSVWLYYRYYPKVYGGKYLIVVVKHAPQSFVITYYITDKIKTGESIWTKK
jgi:hypothetical protein